MVRRDSWHRRDWGEVELAGDLKEVCQYYMIYINSMVT